MLYTTDRVTALATARNNAMPLASTLAGATPATPPAAPEVTVASTIDALAAVIPAGVLGLYTLIVIPIQQYAEKAATSASAVKAAALAKKPGNTQADVKEALARLPQQSHDWLALRWSVLVLTALIVMVLVAQAARAGNAPGKKRQVPVAEALTAVLAFLAWALATPGTPLAAYYSPDDLTIITASIVGVAALLLLALGKGVLTKPAGRARARSRAR